MHVPAYSVVVHPYQNSVLRILYTTVKTSDFDKSEIIMMPAFNGS